MGLTHKKSTPFFMLKIKRLGRLFQTISSHLYEIEKLNKKLLLNPLTQNSCIYIMESKLNNAITQKGCILFGLTPIK
jgi:hypothetical protein